MTIHFNDFDALLTAPSNRDAAVDLARAGFAVFPIRDWGDGDGWKPIADFNNRASSDAAQVLRWWVQWPDARVGLLAGERNGISVLDLDTKNGKDGIASLDALGFSDVTEISPVRVRTPSGGWHLFFRHEPRLKNSASRIGSGVDVKTTGGFVVAPASHKDGVIYAIEGAALGSVELPPFPEKLIPVNEFDATPAVPIENATDEQREWAAEHLSGLASGLSAMGEGGRNDALNAAAMWAGGAAAHGFVDRAAAEGALLPAAEICGLAKREARSTFNSGWKAGQKSPINTFPRALNLDDLDDLDDDFGSLMGSSDEYTGEDPVAARLNLRHAVVAVRGRTLITTERTDGAIDFGTVRDLHTLYANDLVSAGKGKLVAASERWLRSADRRTYANGVTFAPGGTAPGILNLWRGWAVEPDAKASCSRFLEHILKVVCRGNDEHNAYLLSWLAHMVQRPGEKPGVGLVLRGAKGAGKDTVADYVARMIGRRHAPTVAESSHIVGKFNARLENALLLHVQEGSWAGDRKAEGVLKYLVTSDFIEIERKGIDSINLPSVLRMFISANADWVVPASPDERRWAIFEVADCRRGDEAYFGTLRAEMNGQGPAALLHYLRNFDLTGFEVRKAPDTEGLRDQKIASLRGIELWWFELLNRGTLTTASLDDNENWADSGLTVNRDRLRNLYVDWMKGRKFDGETADERLFGKRTREMLPALDDRRLGTRSDRSWHYVLPSLHYCRQAFERWLGCPIDWEWSTEIAG